MYRTGGKVINGLQLTHVGQSTKLWIPIKLFDVFGAVGLKYSCLVVSIHPSLWKGTQEMKGKLTKATF